MKGGLIVSTTKIKESFFEFLFNKWFQEKNIASKTITYVIYNKNNVVCSNIDSWKMRCKEDEFIEKENSMPIDLEELKEFLCTRWNEEIGKEGVKEMDNDKTFIYFESANLFNRAYKEWEKRELEKIEFER